LQNGRDGCAEDFLLEGFEILLAGCGPHTTVYSNG
jgi:hypothetical protein